MIATMHAMVLERPRTALVMRERTLPVAKAGVKCEVTRYPLARANAALSDLRDGRLTGAAVLIPE
jgi:hypothetical protein